MKELFVPYHIALALKEKGFSEPCLGFYSSSANAGDNDFSQFWFAAILDQIDHLPNIVKSEQFTNQQSCIAPTWQQAVDWLLNKHGLYIQLDFGIGWGYRFLMNGTQIPFSEKFVDNIGANTHTAALNIAIEKALKLI